MPAITSPEVYAYARQHGINPLEAYHQLKCAKQVEKPKGSDIVPFFALNPDLLVAEWVTPKTRKSATDIFRANRRFK